MVNQQSLVLIVLVTLVLLPSNHCDQIKLKPTVEIVLSIHAYAKSNILPFTLSSLENQDYPKNRTRLSINFDIYPEILRSIYDRKDERYLRNLVTLNILKSWIRINRPFYHEVLINYNYLDSKDDPLEDVDYWATGRFDKIIKLKTTAIAQASSNWADFLLLMDSDVVLVNTGTLSHLVSAEKSLIAPMLYSLGTYSNYWAGMNKRGYYLRTDDYMPILDRTKLGIFEVPMIHSCILIDMGIPATAQLTFNATHLSNSTPYDDIIAFALSAKLNNMSMFISNEELWGYIMPAVEIVELSRFDQELIDLQLEATIEDASFPLSPSLAHFVEIPKKDRLGVDEVYVINLDRRTERKEAMSKRMDILGINATFWPAVDGKLINEEYLKKRGIKFLPDYEDPYHKRPMTFGEIGCFLSHYDIWKDMIKKNHKFVVILEDDVRFERSFRPRFKALLGAIKKYEESFGGTDLIYLGRKAQTDEKFTQTAINGLILPNYSYWTIGYILTQRGAERLINSKPLEKLLPIDEFLPIMYDKHPNPEWSQHFSPRDLRALSASPLLISPTHYVGDEQYISDTEDSQQIGDNPSHPKNHHQEL
ncbi:glycosyltransferase 25 family member-like [Panonychus citri]|uniref:glycosyltransferase 25 family member-like n=1 Tax=Panonychus citri TaxID=50023 RepID=UPI002306F66E|nr:glycosyltransferase 25 family member-like [Panonychus citri]